MTPYLSTARRRLMPPAAVLAAALVLAACGQNRDDSGDAGGSGDAQELEAVTIGLTFVEDIQFAPFYVALERGYYADAGVDVTLNHHGWEGGFADLAAGTDDVVFAGGGELAEYRDQSGLALVSVATLYQEHPVGLITAADSGIEEPADLAGRVVGTPGFYGETWFGLLAILADAGLDESDLDLQEIGFEQRADLMAGNVDAAMGYVNNDAVQLEQSGFDVRTLPVPAEGLVSVGLVTLQDAVDERPEALAAVVEATLQGMRDVAEDPEGAVEASASYVPDLDREEGRAAALAVLEATIPLFGPEDAYGAQVPEAWAATVRLLSEHGILSGDVEPTELWTDELLPD